MASQADIRRIDNAIDSAVTNLYTKRGGPREFEKNGELNKYEVKSHSYPDDLMASDNRYGGNYVVFYINIAVDSKLAKELGEDQFVKEIPS